MLRPQINIQEKEQRCMKKSKVLPYVYKCTEKETGKFYIGYRYKNYLPANEDFGILYFTSNEYVKNNFKNFDFEILAEFEDKKDAFKYEKKMINETKNELQINSLKHKKEKVKNPPAEITMYCKLEGCGRYINSSITKFCCRTHANIFSAKSRASKQLKTD